MMVVRDHVATQAVACVELPEASVPPPHATDGEKKAIGSPMSSSERARQTAASHSTGTLAHPSSVPCSTGQLFDFSSGCQVADVPAGSTDNACMRFSETAAVNPFEEHLYQQKLAATRHPHTYLHGHARFVSQPNNIWTMLIPRQALKNPGVSAGTDTQAEHGSGHGTVFAWQAS